ncbi:hypothetical protein CE91St43_05710 [Oscillospiraceae bacterium]|nr:hypothetical protein CE91St43_05710 [Oscillospiraceae bacterium]
MEPEDLAVKLEAVDQRTRSNTHRIDDLEQDHKALNRLATAVEVMAAKQTSMGESVDKLTDKVEALEQEPGKRWRFVVEKAIYIIVAAVIGFALARVGLG